MSNKKKINIEIEIGYDDEQDIEFVLSIIKKQIVEGYVEGLDKNETSNYHFKATKSVE